MASVDPPRPSFGELLQRHGAVYRFVGADWEPPANPVSMVIDADIARVLLGLSQCTENQSPTASDSGASSTTPGGSASG